MNSYYLLLEGLFGCTLALITVYDFLMDEACIFIHRKMHFWITLIVLFHYLTTYIAYLALRLLKVSNTNSGLNFIYTGLWLFSLVNYIAFGIIYLLYNRKWRPHE
ncbi:hypothetical protein LL912_12590 [Niabella sp. CC-SYL272]|uniref:hypothetical protein n=1 Tax=Niabella agricola TaxID=2891571 RepID=UPI001F20608E|nr:hypothetical protein [Niabella agricola]MCF3109610.1 hypothetical protein [Niabella agricola]